VTGLVQRIDFILDERSFSSLSTWGEYRACLFKLTEEFPMQNHRRQGRGPAAFTLLEMLLVVALIVLLISLLLPALTQVRETSRRAVCAANMAGIHRGVVAYGTSNQGRIFIVRGRAVQKAFNAIGADVHGNRVWDQDIDWVDAMATVGLAVGPKVNVGGSLVHYQPSELWNCPSRAYKSQWEVSFPQLVVGYQYFGGIDKWTNPYVGSMTARSPLSTKSDGGRTLIADAAMKIDNVWGGGRASAYGGLPAHRDGANAYPAGGNQMSFDGSNQWVEFKKLIFIHSWGGFARTAYFYQKDLGTWNPPATAYGQP